MKKIALIFIYAVVFLCYQAPVSAVVDYQVEENSYYHLPITPIPCRLEGRDPRANCPVEVMPYYDQIGETCAPTFEDFVKQPYKSHYWIEDPAITAQGKADERARQFLYWVLSTSAIDDAAVLRSIWNVSSMIALFGVLLIAVIFGIGYILNKRTSFNFNISIWPTVIKIGMMLLYIVFSAAIVLFLIQVSEVIMKFFYENLGGRDLFNIYFAPGGNLLGQTEESYKTFIGCRDLNIRVKEAIDAEVYLLKMTNVSYYVMGIMLLLRKILLWFLLFVSPFLALLMPFVFIRNTGWIWIGVFFQWLFYGPLLTLFLGGMAKIWREGIPFNFDFSRTSRIDGYIYPTGIIIVYGGPAQRIQGVLTRPIGAGNNGNYVDTFSEYVITLIMLWAVTFFPWWLLRIFRDYCCEGILAMKNILLAMYEQSRSSSPKGPSPIRPSTLPSFKLDLKTPSSLRTDLKFSPVSLNQVHTMITRDIVNNLNLKMNKITDIANMETHNQSKSVVNQNLAYLSNPAKAATSTDRQQYMNIRTELFNRALKNDSVARTILSSTSTSQSEKLKVYQEVLRTIPQTVSIQQIKERETSQPKEKVQSVTNNYMRSISNNTSIVNNISNATHTSNETVKSVLNSYSNHMSQPIAEVVKTIAQETKTSESTVREVLKQNESVSAQSGIVREMAKTQQLTQEQSTNILNAIKDTTTQSTVISTPVSNTVAKAINMESSTAQTLVKNIYNSASQNIPLVQQIANSTQINAESVRNVIQSFANNINQSSTELLQNISAVSNVSSNQVRQILNTLTQSFNSSPETVKQISQITNTSEQIVQQVVKTVPETLKEQSAPSAPNDKEPIVKVVSYRSHATEEAARTAITNVMNSVVQNQPIVESLAQQTGLRPQQITSVITTYTQNLDRPRAEIMSKIYETSGVKKEQVEKTLNTISDGIISSHTIVQEVARQQGMKEEDVSQVIQGQMQIATAPDQNIEKTIAMPQSVSLEDYEEVKTMWSKHYEEADVPVTETIKNREDWVQQDIVFITNTLNKLLSPDEKVRQQGLDELGYLLPVILINNLKGEELLVYLKAKLEAAKATLKTLEKEKQMKASLSANETEEDILVDRAAQETEEKHMAVGGEEDEFADGGESDDSIGGAEQTPQSIEDRVKAVQEKLDVMDQGAVKEGDPSLDSLKSKLREKAEESLEN